MNKFIKLTHTQCAFVEQNDLESTKLITDTYEEVLYIRPCDIKRIERVKNSTFIYFYNEEKPKYVNETPEEIFKLIEECGKKPKELDTHTKFQVVCSPYLWGKPLITHGYTDISSLDKEKYFIWNNELYKKISDKVAIEYPVGAKTIQIEDISQSVLCVDIPLSIKSEVEEFFKGGWKDE